MSSILTSFSTDGIAIPIRISTGMMVHAASSRALCRSFWSATAPFDFRKRTMARIIAPKVKTAMTEADPEHDHVHVVDLARELGHALRHVDQAPVRAGGQGSERRDARRRRPTASGTDWRWSTELPGCGPRNAGSRPAHRKGWAARAATRVFPFIPEGCAASARRRRGWPRRLRRRVRPSRERCRGKARRCARAESSTLARARANAGSIALPTQPASVRPRAAIASTVRNA